MVHMRQFQAETIMVENHQAVPNGGQTRKLMPIAKRFNRTSTVSIRLKAAIDQKWPIGDASGNAIRLIVRTYLFIWKILFVV